VVLERERYVHLAALARDVVLEERPTHVLVRGERRAAHTPLLRLGAETYLSVLVVHLSLFLVGQDLVRFVDEFELTHEGGQQVVLRMRRERRTRRGRALTISSASGLSGFLSGCHSFAFL